MSRKNASGMSRNAHAHRASRLARLRPRRRGPGLVTAGCNCSSVVRQTVPGPAHIAAWSRNRNGYSWAASSIAWSAAAAAARASRSEEHTSELQSRGHLVCRLLLEKKKACHTQSVVQLHEPCEEFR